MAAKSGFQSPAKTAPKAAVPAFGSRPFRDREASAAIDSALTGLRRLAEFGGGSREDIDATTNVADLVAQAAVGMRGYLPTAVRPAYHALFVGIGEKCRGIVARLNPHHAVPHVTDVAVARSLRGQIERESVVDGSRLLRMALAAELAIADSAPSSGASRNPLRGLLDLYAMGAVLRTESDAPPSLSMANGRRLELAWTGNPFSRNLAGHLRPAAELDLSF